MEAAHADPKEYTITLQGYMVLFFKIRNQITATIVYMHG